LAMKRVRKFTNKGKVPAHKPRKVRTRIGTTGGRDETDHFQKGQKEKAHFRSRKEGAGGQKKKKNSALNQTSFKVKAVALKKPRGRSGKGGRTQQVGAEEKGRKKKEGEKKIRQSE